MGVRLQISNKLQSEGRTMAWLASKIGCTRQHVSLMMMGEATITKDRLRKINKALKTKFKHK